MDISINSASATVAASQASLSSGALGQQSPAVQDQAAPITVEPVDPAAAAARLAKYLRALGAPLQMGTDAQHIANALTSTMQTIVAKRPDLANAHFDFQSSDGSIQVVSSDLSAGDKTWVEGLLNHNTDLVLAVKSFHDDAVAGYATWADADGSPLTPSQSDAVSTQADGLVSFLNLFQNLGNAAQKYQMKDGVYKTSDGAAMNLAQDPSTAAGFLGFIKSAQASASGAFSFVATSGRTTYGGQMNIFDNTSIIPNFFPDFQTRSLGLSETA